MGRTSNRFYRVGEVATMTRVSIRTLHHYDRIGLLRPTSTSVAGYRQYAATDLLRLQQILTLRDLGFPLRRIGELLDRPDYDLIAALRIQRQVLRERIGQLERTDLLLGELVRRREGDGDWNWALVAQAVAEAGQRLVQREEQMEAYYTPEQMKRFEELGTQVPREEIAGIEAGWTVLIDEVRIARLAEMDPTGEEARGLADRWEALTAQTTSHFPPDLNDAIKTSYERGAFEGDDRAPRQADFAWIAEVQSRRGSTDSSPRLE